MFKKRHPKVGARPGTLIIPADALPPQVRLIQYAPDFVREELIEDVAHIEEHLDEASVTWINVCGLGDETTLRQLADLFSVHPLAMEDIVNVPQRPKAELYGDQQLIVCRAVCLIGEHTAQDEQVSMLLGSNYVITFQEDYSDPLSAVRQRIQIADSRLRQSGSDYLAYVILDSIVDAYYPVLETLGENLERLEDSVIEHPHPALLKQLNTIRQRLSRLRRAIWPERELIRSLVHDENLLMGGTGTTVPARHVRPRSAGDRGGRHVPGIGQQPNELVHLGRRTSHQRSDEGTDDHVEYLRTTHLRGRHLWHEL